MELLECSEDMELSFGSKTREGGLEGGDADGALVMKRGRRGARKRAKLSLSALASASFLCLLAPA